MKKTFPLLTVFLLFVIGQKVTAQEYIKNFDGIPILSIAPGDVSQNHFTKMKEMGVNVVLAQNIDNTVLQWIYKDSMKAIPWQTDSTLMNHIIKYTEGRYTKLEAEGQPEADGLATLNINHSIGDSVSIAGVTGILTKEMAPAGTLIDGPGYRQEVRYSSIQPTDSIYYYVDFLMKLNYSHEETGSPSDEICILQVTNSRIINGSIAQVQVITADTLLRSDFTIGAWYTAQLSYDLTSLNFGEETTYNRVGVDSQQTTRTYASFIEFKVIWKGDSTYRLFVDNITVYDQRGLGIVTNDVDKGLVDDQAKFSFNFSGWENTVVAWFALDEPECIDNYEPMRMVNHILDSVSAGKRGLWVSFPSSWNGKFGDSELGTHKLYKFEEFYRRTKIKSFQNNHPLYHYPYANADSCGGCDYRLANIDYLINSALDRLNDYDSIYFSTTLLCGRVNEARLFHEPLPHEMLYEANLKLLYGAKSLSLFRYFGTEDTTTFSGLVNPLNGGGYVYTPRYDFVKDVLSPRLIGLMGKTLKTAIPDTQFAGSNAVDATDLQGGYFGTNGYDKLEKINSIGNIESPICEIELGFFHNKSDAEKKYFMAVNRHYSNKTKLVFSLKNLNEYNNWELRDYVEDSRVTLNAAYTGTAFFNDTITVGDARLYSILPVVKYGGKLITDETISAPTTLTEDMTIESGATFYINSTYTAKGNITIKNGGRIVGGNSGSIVFTNSHQLCIEGAAQVNGILSNRLNLNFSSSDSAGVVVKQGGVLSSSFCEIQNAATGIEAQTGSSLNVSNVNINNCSNNGIAFLGFINGLPTPVINKCNITGSYLGISAVNCVEAVIKGNTITNSHLGIFLSQINVSHILNNNIVGYNYQSSDTSSMPGIFMNSCGGYLRNNLIKNHKYGVQLAYSSPEMGSNTIEDNLECGLYIGTGSVPNLIFYMVNPHCWYPIRGCNIIRNSGRYNGEPPFQGEGFPIGTEIYLENGDISLRWGGNEISDDRQNIPSSLTLPLINGSCGDTLGRILSTSLNYWGIVGPSQSRFGTLNIEFDSVGVYCPLPNSPCSLNDIVIQTTDGIAVDTIGSRNAIAEAPPEEMEQEYAQADMLFASGNISEAQTIYQQIVQDEYTSKEKLPAYNKLYEIGNILNEEPQYFNALKSEFINISLAETDTLLQKRYHQNSILCDVSNEEYLEAIMKFNDIIQQNPTSEEAVYAEIDIMTTSLNLDTTNSQLGKATGGRYFVKRSADYLSKLSEIMNKKFSGGNKKSKQLIPSEYSLSQNYPNPFNPTTKIKYQLPNAAQVSLKVYDILGREISTLVNEEKPAGYYQIDFNASSLSSGCYFYRIVTKDFVKTMKMLVVK